VVESLDPPRDCLFSHQCCQMWREREIDWEAFVTGWPVILNSTPNRLRPVILRGKFTFVIERYNMLLSRQKYENLVDKSLQPRLSISRSMEATNPRDHVFAILNIDSQYALRFKERAVKLDYKKDAAHIFTDATIKTSEVKQDLRFLTLIENLKEDNISVSTGAELTPLSTFRRKDAAFPIIDKSGG